MGPQLNSQGVNVVIRGDFNPAVLHPSWLAAKELIRPQEADTAQIEVVHAQIAVFTAGWLQMHVTVDRFQAATAQEPYFEALRDLTVGVFTLLNHTPTRSLGINRDFHYDVGSEEVWHRLGHRLAPKEDWEDVLVRPGMRTIAVQGARPDDLKGYVRVRVEPSTRVKYGIYVSINDHYDLLSAAAAVPDADEAVEILSTQWAESMQRGLQIAQTIARLGEPL